MPNHKSCEKRLRQDEKRQARNNYVRKTLKTLSKKMHSEMDLKEKQDLLQEVYSQLDKAAKKGVIHARTASRRKSRIAQYINSEVKKTETASE
ncbi:MAG: 30S ribosomal protein S20 [Candidatus Cloacimonetes bacterium]|jgi:small subunit ribosomal protein S20|nr:30S ribosomal protein S20 [Candidatus Cloacimonadota bacterium]MDD4156959.1 30S ribosomal protein S20 [Candidatus Cloacimonadota bacterium]